MRGEIAFEPALRERVALLEGLPVTVVDGCCASAFKLTPAPARWYRPCAASGAHTALVSGGFTLSPTASRRYRLQ